MDFAAGSGHFLTESMHEIQRFLNEKVSNNYISDTAKKIKAWQGDHFDWATKYRKVGCYLHGDGLANVILSDGLASFKNTKEYKGALKKCDSTFPKENKQFDIVLSNPPYSVSSFKNATRELYGEEDFDLYGKLTDHSSEIECLFVERTKQLLKDGGMAGIILPSSILSNTGIYTKTREIILQNFEIIAIAQLGSNTFMATGTNTVTLFLKRRNNYDSINLRESVEKFFFNLKDITLNGIEYPVSKYIAHVWRDTSFDDYKTFPQKQPNEAIQQHEIYREYVKKIQARNSDDRWNLTLKLEAEKLFYFILAYPQKIVLVNSGQKKDEKQFLGYKFSNRRGSEGIHPVQGGKSIDECTSLFDTHVFDNPEKASTYIYKAFSGDLESPIHENLQKNISRADLVDLLTFDRVDFEKSISLSAKKKWKLVPLGDLAKIENGGTPRSDNPEYWNKGIPWATLVDTKEKYLTKTVRSISQMGLARSSAVLLPINTVLFSSRATIGDVSIAKIKTSTNQGYKNFICNPQKIKFEYLYYILKMESKNIESLASGMAYPEISKTLISEYKIPLPPLGVQQEIIGECESLDTEIAQADQSIALRKQQIESLISSVENTEKLHQVIEKVSDIVNSKDEDGLVNYIGLENIESGTGVLTGSTQSDYSTIQSNKNVGS